MDTSIAIDQLVNDAIGLFKQEQVKAAFDKLETAYQQEPHNPLVTYNLAACYINTGEEAEGIRWLQATLALNPTHFQALFLLGKIYVHRPDNVKALEHLTQAYTINPNHHLVNVYLGLTYARQKEYTPAINHYQIAHNLKPCDAHTAAYLYYTLAFACDWNRLKNIHYKLDELANTGTDSPPGELGEPPFINLIRVSDSQKNLRAAQIWSQALFARNSYSAQPKHTSPLPNPHSPLKVAYFSFDFKDHVNMHHLLGILENHDRKHFDISCYAYNEPESQKLAQRLIEAYGHRFINLWGKSDEEAARIIAADSINILIDINGYTTGNRIMVCAHHPAPIQVEFLGFPGTTALPFIDYCLTDSVAVPPSEASNYTEKVAYLPDSYMPVSYTHLKIPSSPSRHSVGLPEKSIVFCSFNDTYKIDQHVFQAWCQILKKVPKSVLWLSANDKLTIHNLREAAKVNAINPNRLIFSPHIHIENHLARITLADIALDTFRYNGGATTADALRAGVPVITKTGTHYASRFSTSILTAAGLPELITTTSEEYINLAIKIAKKPELLEQIKAKLSNPSALFDIKTYTQNLERLYQKMWDRYSRHQPPEHLSI